MPRIPHCIALAIDLAHASDALAGRWARQHREGLAEFLGPSLEGAQNDGRYDASWPSGRPWAQGTPPV